MSSQQSTKAEEDALKQKLHACLGLKQGYTAATKATGSPKANESSGEHKASKRASPNSPQLEIKN